MAQKAKVQPVGFRQLLDVTQLGIKQHSIRFKNVTLESSKWLCVREEAQLAIIEVGTKNILRLPVKVDSAIMNPVSKVVALRAGQNLQIYNLEMKHKMKTTMLPDVVFWKWVDPKTIAIVTDKAVFNWKMDQENPKKIFDRNPTSGPVQIINYRASADNKWLILGGISPGEGRPKGVLQVFSVDINASQPTMDAHAACFAHVKLDGRNKPSNLFCFSKIDGGEARLHVLEVGVPREQAFKMSSKMRFNEKDFPVAMLPDNNHGCLFVLSKAGLLFVYEIQSGKCIFGQQASTATMFASCVHSEKGIVTVDQSGRLGHFFIDRDHVVEYITSTLNDYELGMAMARRYNLGGGQQMFEKQFEALMQQGNYQAAVQLASTAPQGVMRNLNTINRLKALGTGPQSPLLQYFTLLLKTDTLNAVESVELSQRILETRGAAGVTPIANFVRESKLTPSEDLGDLLKNSDLKLALSVYLRAKVPDKVIGCFLALGAQETNQDAALELFGKIFKYAQQNNYEPDYPLLVQQLLRVNAERAKDFALLLIRSETPNVDIHTMTQAFMAARDVKNTTNILLEYLRSRGDREEDAGLQTQLLEINLLSMPRVADAILESEEYQFSHFDKYKIAQLCERAQLYHRALAFYTDLEDIKRVLSNTHAIKPEFLLEYFGRMTPESCLECLRDLLKFNMHQNMNIVVEVAKKWNEHLTAQKLILMFEDFNAWNGLFVYLASFVHTSEDPEVVFKYVEAGVKLSQTREVERVCRDHQHYDPPQMKEFLLEKNLRDPRPLIHVCDRFGFVDQLTEHLYKQQMFPFIEAYVTRMNTKSAPAVIGKLLDLNANEDNIRSLINSVRPPPDDEDFMARLVGVVHERNRLGILREWAESRAAEGNEAVELHNALAMIYVDTNNNPQKFLLENDLYDKRVVGKYCEGRDPHLSLLAYKRAAGDCDQELVELTNKNGLFKEQARYLVERQDMELWAQVLVEDNVHRRDLIDQVVATALPESTIPEEVSTTVKAFMNANLPNELIELLERIILHGASDGVFRQNKNLQNLLILTAIKADKQRVMDYINRLDNYDGPDIAKIAVSEQYQLYEEAYTIYRKFQKNPEAILVLLNNIKDLQRAVDYAEYCNQPDVWSLLAHAQLEENKVADSIASYLRADDPKDWEEVVAAAKREDLFEPLIEYIQMARLKIREPALENELVYAFARTDKLADLEEFINAPNVAKLEAVGDMCYQEKLFKAARILFSRVNNQAKLAMALVMLGSFQDAVDAASRANAIPTWKAVCYACVDAEEFRLAQRCGINIIVYNDHMTELIQYYEERGHFEELIQLMESGMLSDRAHQGIFTQLGILYSNYKEEKLMEHIKLHVGNNRINIPTLLGACRASRHWNEVVFLYTAYKQFENAVETMMEHSTVCWRHDEFKDLLRKASNTEVYYRAVTHYLKEQPLLLNDLLLGLADTLDHTRVVSILRSHNHLALAMKYLLGVQNEDLTAINEAVNQLWLEEENHEQLRSSIDSYTSFDQIALAQRTENHELMEMRRIAAALYKTNGRFGKSLELSKRDKLWGDAMTTVADSGDQKLAEDTLRFFVEKGKSECFSACLYTCYHLLRPDVVMELAWRKNLMHHAMPFMIQSFRHMTDRIHFLTTKVTDLLEKEEEKTREDENVAFAPPGVGMLALPPATGMYAPPQQPQYPPGAFPPQF